MLAATTKFLRQIVPPVIATLIAAVMIAGFNAAFQTHLTQPRMAALHPEANSEPAPARAAPAARDHVADTRHRTDRRAAGATRAAARSQQGSPGAQAHRGGANAGPGAPDRAGRRNAARTAPSRTLCGAGSHAAP